MTPKGAHVADAMFVLYKLLVPLRSGTVITVQSRLRVVADSGLTSAEIDRAKATLEAAVKKYWNGALIMVIDDPQCPRRTLGIEYVPQWVTSGEHRVLLLHRNMGREFVLQGKMHLGLNTTPKDCAHEFGHAVGENDEYSYNIPFDQQLHYRKPDGSQETVVVTPSGTSDGGSWARAKPCASVTAGVSPSKRRSS